MANVLARIGAAGASASKVARAVSPAGRSQDGQLRVQSQPTNCSGYSTHKNISVRHTPQRVYPRFERDGRFQARNVVGFRGVDGYVDWLKNAIRAREQCPIHRWFPSRGAAATAELLLVRQSLTLPRYQISVSSTDTSGRDVQRSLLRKLQSLNRVLWHTRYFTALQCPRRRRVASDTDPSLPSPFFPAAHTTPRR